MGLIPSNLITDIRSKFNTLKSETNKEVTVYGIPNKEDCPNCWTSPDTGMSTGVFNDSFVTPVEIFGTTYSPMSFTRGRCPVCNGKGSIEQATNKKILCIVHWNPTNKGDLNQTQAGLEGSNVVRIKTGLDHYNLLRDCKYIEVDNVKCYPSLPPTIISLSKSDILVVGYFTSSEVGKSIKD